MMKIMMLLMLKRVVLERVLLLTPLVRKHIFSSVEFLPNLSATCELIKMLFSCIMFECEIRYCGFEYAAAHYTYTHLFSGSLNTSYASATSWNFLSATFFSSSPVAVPFNS